MVSVKGCIPYQAARILHQRLSTIDPKKEAMTLIDDELQEKMKNQVKAIS
jgi:hypothetical protein